MKTNPFTLAVLLILLLLGFLIMPAKSAVVVSLPNTTDYNQLLLNSTTIWDVVMIAGFSSTGTPEITVTANGVQSTDHVWSYPEQVEISYDIAGNLNVRAGSTTLYSQPTGLFNAVLIQIGDRAFFGPTELKASTFNGTNLPNLSADDNNTGSFDYDQMEISGFGDTFQFDTSFYLNQSAAWNESSLWIKGINVPEPNAFVLPISSLILLLFRKR